MKRITILRAAFVAVFALGLFGAFLVAAIPAQAALPAADAYQVTVVPPDVEVTVVVPDTGSNADTTTTTTLPTWALIFAGIVVVALIAIAAAGSRSTRSDV